MTEAMSQDFSGARTAVSPRHPPFPGYGAPAADEPRERRNSPRYIVIGYSQGAATADVAGSTSSQPAISRCSAEQNSVQ